MTLAIFFEDHNLLKIIDWDDKDYQRPRYGARIRLKGVLELTG